MDIRGEKFIVDFSDDEDEHVAPSTVDAGYGMLDNFVLDIKERDVASAKPPAAPNFKNTPTGFPEHKRRGVSAFKQRRTAGADVGSPKSISARQMSGNASPSASKPSSFDEVERDRIDKENKDRIAAMSDSEIRAEREELLSNLSPALVQMMLKKANLDEARGDTWTSKSNDERLADSSSPYSHQLPRAVSPSIVAEAVPIDTPAGTSVSTRKTVTWDDDAPPRDPGILQPVKSFVPSAVDEAALSMHFPRAPAHPDLDPDDPDFLSSLHEKYFPDLQADASKLAWMAPIPTHGSLADQDSPYYPGAEGLNASDLRFDFRGELLPPRIARALPVTKGLHHHGDSPESAGYTIGELSRLSRSSLASQRCIAFQTLGRLLYRLGMGKLGQAGDVMVDELWKCIARGQIIATLEEYAAKDHGHLSSRVYAQEALWLYHKSNGQEKLEKIVRAP